MIEAIRELLLLVPRKPRYYSHMFHCPTCKSIVRIGFSDKKQEKCKCGQAIDWGEEE